MSEIKKRTIGDLVTWDSQAGGNAKQKSGVIVAVIRMNLRPCREQFPDLHKMGCGFGRDHESYVVRVDIGKKPGKSFRHYWPRASALRAV